MPENNKTRVTLKVGLSRAEREAIAADIENRISISMPTAGVGPENFYPGNAGAELYQTVTQLQSTLTNDYVSKAELGNITDFVSRDEFNELTNGASELLDTFKEIGDAIGNDANFATTLKSEFARFDKGLDSLKVYTYLDVDDEVDDTLIALPDILTSNGLPLELVSISARGLNNTSTCIELSDEYDIEYDDTDHPLIHFNEPIYLYATGSFGDPYYGYDRLDVTKGIIERHCVLLYIKDIVEHWGELAFGSSSTNTIKLDSIASVLGVDIQPASNSTYRAVNNTFPLIDIVDVEVNNGAIRFKSVSASNPISGKTNLKAYLDAKLLEDENHYLVLVSDTVDYEDASGMFICDTKYTPTAGCSLVYEYRMPTIQLAYLSSSELVYSKEQIDAKFALIPDISKISELKYMLTLADSNVHYLYTNLGSSTIKEELTDITSNSSSSLFIVQLATKTVEQSGAMPEIFTADSQTQLAAWIEGAQNVQTTPLEWTDNDMTVSVVKGNGSTNPAFYNGSSNHLRFYKNNLVTISVAEGFKIRKVTLTSPSTSSSQYPFSSACVLDGSTSGFDLEDIDTIGRVSTITPTGNTREISFTLNSQARFVDISAEYYDENAEIPDEIVEITTIVFSNEYGIYRPISTYPYLEKVYDITPDVFVFAPVSGKNVSDLYQGRSGIYGNLPIDEPGSIDNFFQMRVKSADPAADTYCTSADLVALKPKTRTVTILASDWQNSSFEISLGSVTVGPNDVLYVTPDDASSDAYYDCGITRSISQDGHTLTLTASTVPEDSIVVQIVYMAGEAF